MGDFSSILDSLKEFLGDYGAPLALGAQGFGTYLQAQSRNKIDQAQRQRMAEEAARQADLQARATAASAGALPRFTPQAQSQEQSSIADKLRAMITPKAVANEAEFINGGVSAPTEIGERMHQTLAKSLAKGADYAKTLANLSSYGRQGQNNSIALGREGQEISRIASDSAHSSAILPFELNKATLSGRPLAVAADAANGLGSLAFLGAITKKKAANGSVLPGGVGSGTNPY